MEKIKIMISSTVDDLLAERDAINDLYKNDPLFEIIGATPFINSSSASSSAIKTLDLAKECDLYILIMGSKYGYKLDNGKSATEVEFDAAYHQDPTKVLVFLKKGDAEEDQKIFIKKVSEYYSGYWRVEFNYTHQLQTYVKESVLSWIKDRAAFTKKMSYCEHFIREAIRLKPNIDTKVYYSVREKYIEIEYCDMGQKHSVHLNRSEVVSDFWGCLYKLQMDINKWSELW